MKNKWYTWYTWTMDHR